jgi:hypothetical protein
MIEYLKGRHNVIESPPSRAQTTNFGHVNSIEYSYTKAPAKSNLSELTEPPTSLRSWSVKASA